MVGQRGGLVNWEFEAFNLTTQLLGTDTFQVSFTIELDVLIFTGLGSMLFFCSDFSIFYTAALKVRNVKNWHFLFLTKIESAFSDCQKASQVGVSPKMV